MDAEKPPVVDRISFLKVPIDILPPECMADKIYEMVNSKRGQNIVLLSLWDLLRARRNEEYRSYVLNAGLVIPISKSIVGGARFLTGKTPIRYMPFDFVIQLLTILEKREFSVYLLGGAQKNLLKVEKNIRQTFVRLRIVGRYSSAFKRQKQGIILEAVRKASPSLLLISKGVRGKERWIPRNSANLNQGLRMWCSDLFEVFAEKRRRPSRKVFERGLEWIGFCIHKPWHILRIFLYFYYKILLVIHRLFK